MTSFDFDLGIDGYRYSDLHRPERLRALAESFYAGLAASDPALWSEFEPYLATAGAGIEPVKESELLIRAAAHLSTFLGDLFGVHTSRQRMLDNTAELGPVFRFKKEFVLRRCQRKLAATPDAAAVDPAAVEREISELQRMAFPDTRHLFDPELAMAAMVCRLLDLEQAYKERFSPKSPQPLAPGAHESVTQWMAALARYAADNGTGPSQGEPDAVDRASQRFVENLLGVFERWAMSILADAHRRERYAATWVSFRIPEKVHYPDGLVPHVRPRHDLPELILGPESHLRQRDGFKLTDPRWSEKEALDHTHYCLICHERKVDSCARGYPMPRPTMTGGKNPLGITLNGCPLEERISEMHALKRQGDSIAALAVAMIDNPMCPATGHRICNDCMKACIFQKQEPVNIPQIETNCLTTVLELPYGFEIYGLLTRWNPLNVKRPYALPYNGRNVLVVGLGPAGINLAQWLLNEGFGVVGIDGLKIESLDPQIIGRGLDAPRAIRDYDEIKTELDERIGVGFGGVAEYGITVRWDKNFLTVMDITLRRRDKFRVYGGIRFGGTLEIDDAWELGFDHIAIAAGAGRPTVVEMKNTLMRNIRTASDFLMGLQLTGAFKKFSMANLQLQLPCIVIGSGLTAIDTATEAMAYYPLQVEKILERFEVLASERGEATLWSLFDAEERSILGTFLEHGRAVRGERERARRAGEKPAFIPLLKQWGGVKICYRKRMVDSPAYRLNHEEIIKCFEEGIEFVENVNPIEALPDDFGAVGSLVLERLQYAEGQYRPTGEQLHMPARTVFMAAGTTPNIIYEKEHPGTFVVDPKRRCFAPYHIAWQDGRPRLEAVPGTYEDPGFFTSYEKNGRFITFFGDNHPVYAGSVVKAMGSAKRGFRDIARLFAPEIAAQRPDEQPRREAAWEALVARLDDQIVARVVEVRRLTPTVVEVVVRAPYQSRKFHPGQFYRLQNYEMSSPLLDGTRLQMEGLALTGAWVDREQGLLSLIILEMGGSSRLCAMLKKGEEVVVMGPTGEPTEIPAGQLVILCGGGLGNAVLFSVAQALRANGSRVVYFAGYKKPEDVFLQEEIEKGCDQVIWSVDQGTSIAPRRPQDRSFVGNIVQAMVAYASGQLGGPPQFQLRDAARIISIGSDRMMAAVTRARREALATIVNPEHVAISSINSPMQCMMKEICGQCLQRHVDTATGKMTYVFSCFNQDQKSDCVDWKNLNDRLRMNTVQEKICNLWLDRILSRAELQLI